MKRNSYLGGSTILTSRNLNWKTDITDPKLSDLENNIAHCNWAINGIKSAVKRIDALLTDATVFTEAEHEKYGDKIKQKLLQAKHLLEQLDQIKNIMATQYDKFSGGDLSLASVKPIYKAKFNEADDVAKQLEAYSVRIPLEQYTEKTIKAAVRSLCSRQSSR
jgi:hypothetical protein